MNVNERLLFLYESDITQSKLYDMVPARVCGTVDNYDGVYVIVYDRGRDLYLTIRRKQCAVLIEYRLSDDQCSDSDCDYVATGGNAIVSRYLGQGQEKQARKALTEFVVIGVLISTVFAVLVILFEDPICRFLGANDELMADCKAYLTISMLFAPACTLQTLFQSYFVTASRPGLGLWLTVAAGILNAVLDYVLIVPIPLGIAGAALATGFRTAASCCGGTDLFCNSA